MNDSFSINPPLTAVLADYLGRSGELPQWLSARVDELAQIFDAVRFKEAARRQVMVEDTHTMTLSWYQAFLDDSLEQATPPRCVVVQSISFLWSDTPTDRPGNPFVAMSYSWDVFDALDLNALGPAAEPLPRVLRSALVPHLPYRFGNGSWGSSFTIDVPSYPDLSASLEAKMGHQLKMWDRERSFAKLVDVMERQVGLPGRSRVASANIGPFFKSFLDNHHIPLHTVLAQFEKHAQALGFSMHKDIATLPGSSFVGSDGVARTHSGVETRLLEDGETIRLVRAGWKASWHDDRQQMDLALRLMVLPHANHDGVLYSLELPPLNLTSRSDRNEYRIERWLNRFSSTLLEHDQGFAQLAETSLLELAP